MKHSLLLIQEVKNNSSETRITEHPSTAQFALMHILLWKMLVAVVHSHRTPVGLFRKEVFWLKKQEEPFVRSDSNSVYSPYSFLFLLVWFQMSTTTWRISMHPHFTIVIWGPSPNSMSFGISRISLFLWLFYFTNVVRIFFLRRKWCLSAILWWLQLVRLLVRKIFHWFIFTLGNALVQV